MSKELAKDHPLYTVWEGMRYRCSRKTHKSFHNYGGRGITVCDEWNTVPGGFWKFIDWNSSLEEPDRWSRGLYIDRIDNDGGYSPTNCRWVTVKDNNRNKRDNRYINETGGLFAEYYEKHNTGVKYRTAFMRYFRQGWLIHEAVTLPVLEEPSIYRFGNHPLRTNR